MLVLGGLWLGWLNRATPDVPDAYGYRWAQATMPLAWGAVGLLLAIRVPHNRIAPLCLVVSAVSGINFFLDGYAGYAVVTRPGSLPGGTLAAWAVNWTWVPLVASAAVYFPLLFPDGHPPTPGWGRVGYIAAALVVVTIAVMALQPGPIEQFPVIQNPIGVRGLTRDAMWFPFTALVACALAAVGSQIGRYRSATQDERLQIKWVAAAASLAGLAFVFAALGEGPLGEYAKALATAFVLSITLLPIATAVAVLRYRLYEIDVLINRTFVYVPLTGLLAGLYIAMIGVLRDVFTAISEAGSEASIALSTLIIVSLLTPLKNQLQTVVDRRFREAPDPAQALNRLREQGRAYAEVADLDAFLARYVEQIAVAFGARAATIEPAAGIEAPARRYAAGEPLADAVLAAPLPHEGRPLGRISLGPRQDGRPYSDAQADALGRYAETAAHLVALLRRAPDDARIATPAL